MATIIRAISLIIPSGPFPLFDPFLNFDSSMFVSNSFHSLSFQEKPQDSVLIAEQFDAICNNLYFLSL
jgi:hypothetical protein